MSGEPVAPIAVSPGARRPCLTDLGAAVTAFALRRSRPKLAAPALAWSI